MSLLLHRLIGAQTTPWLAVQIRWFRLRLLTDVILFIYSNLTVPNGTEKWSHSTFGICKIGSILVDFTLITRRERTFNLNNSELSFIHVLFPIYDNGKISDMSMFPWVKIHLIVLFFNVDDTKLQQGKSSKGKLEDFSTLMSELSSQS